MSMLNSLEVRVPFADKRLVKYAFNMSQKIKFAGGREKGLLRKFLVGILPDDIVRRKTHTQRHIIWNIQRLCVVR